jgi:Ca-activated chloride channel family protein
VRGGLTIDGADAAPLARVPVGTTVAAGAAGLSDMSLDSGPRLLLDGGAQVRLLAEDAIELVAGRSYLDVLSGDALEVTTPGGSIALADASVSAVIEGGSTRLYIVRGELSWRAGEHRGFARAGEELVLNGSDGTLSPATLWDDWTGGLVQPGPAGAAVAPGLGMLEARVPDEIGMARWPLVIRRLEVSVRIEGPLAITEVTEEFFNPASDTVEGLYRVSVPEGAVLQRFAVDRNGVLVDGYVREQAAARAAYEALVYRGSTEDPALLEWDAPGSYRARIYPIAPGESRRIAIRYAEWLTPAREGGPLLYRYPMSGGGGGAGAPRIGELAFVAELTGAGASRVRAGMGATVENGRVELRRSDFRPRADLWLELFADDTTLHGYHAPHSPPERAPNSRVIVGEADERDYFYLPLRLPERLFGGAPSATSAPLDVVVVADVSAGTDRSRLELGRAVVESIAGHLGESDRLSVVGADLRLRPLLGEVGEDRMARMALGPASDARVDGALDALARMPVGGASDLGASLAEAASLLDPTREGIVVYVGDGAPTVGEMEADELRQHLSELPHPVRLYAIAVGGEANLDLLAELVRGGGLAMRVEEHQAAANASLRLFAHAARPVIEDLTVDLGTGIENVFPRVSISTARGEVIDVVGRIRDGVPAEVTLNGTFHGVPFTETIPITAAVGEDPVDLRLRWANERLRQQLREGASREEVAELGTRYGLITPYTSYYVPSRTELASLPSLRRMLRHSDVLEEPSASELANAGAAAVLLGPLSLMGCTDMRNAPGPQGSPVSASTPTTVTGSVTPEEESANGYFEDDTEEGERAPAPVMPSPPPVAAAPSVVAPEAAARAEPAEAMRGGGALRADSALDDSIGLDGTGYGGGGTGEGTIGLGGLGTIGAGSGTGSGYGVGGRAGGDSPVRRSRGRSPSPDEDERSREPADLRLGGEGRAANEISEALDPAPSSGSTAHGARDGGRYATTVVTIVTTTTVADHTRSRCSDASRASLGDRVALWRERLRQSDSVSSWVETYRNAIRDCEARTPRERRSLLNEMIDRAGSIASMLSLYSYLSDGSARGTLRSAILRRVRTPDDLRMVRARFGSSGYTDWALIEQVLARATTPAARLRALRQLVSQQPESFELRLRLLQELEAQGRLPDAARLAEDLRTDPLADAGVRTAIGEMFLRFGQEDEARRAFSEIVEFAPLDELARRRLGDLYRAHGWFEDAYRQYQTLATIRPDDPTVLLLLASAAAGTGRTDEALRLEQRLMETSSPYSGASRDGIARVAQLWSSVRFAMLRAEAREAGDETRLAALSQRMRRSGVLNGAGAFRATLTWSHPDARVSLWASHPSMPVTRPEELSPEFGIEAFDVAEQEEGAYRIEVRRSTEDRLGTVEAQLVMVWNEGRSDEVVRVVPLTFDAAHARYAYTVTGTNVADVSGAIGGGR